MTVSNASCKAIAETLEGARWGTFSGVIVRLKGFERGRGAGKKKYADALVHDVVVTGFSYRAAFLIAAAMTLVALAILRLWVAPRHAGLDARLTSTPH